MYSVTSLSNVLSSSAHKFKRTTLFPISDSLSGEEKVFVWLTLNCHRLEYRLLESGIRYQHARPQPFNQIEKENINTGGKKVR